MLINYNIRSDFLDQYNSMIENHLLIIKQIKEENPWWTSGIFDSSQTDRWTTLRYYRGLMFAIELSHLFEGRRVVDMGCGTGNYYFALKFGNPALLNGFDPYQENIDIAAKYGYDNLYTVGYEDYPFTDEDLLFIRSTGAPWEDVIEKVKDKIKDVVIIERFVNDNQREDLYCHDPMFDLTPCRFLFDKKIDTYMIMTVAKIRRLFDEAGYDCKLLYPTNMAFRNTPMPWFRLHFQKRI